MSESHDEPVVESAVADSTQESTTEESVTTSELSIEDIAKERDESKTCASRASRF